MEYLTPENLAFSAAAIVVLCFLLDFILRLNWNRGYFTGGLPFVSLRITVLRHHNNLPPPARLELGFDSFWSGALIFRPVAPDTYGFRTPFLRISLLHIGDGLHGMLYFDREHSQVVMKGFADLGPLALLLVLLGVIVVGGVSSMEGLVALSLCALIISGWYIPAVYRFQNVARFAASVWARARVPEVELYADE